MARYDFASDNTAPATPEALEALIAANSGFTSGYGSDTVSREAADLVRATLDADAEVRFVASGTAANSIALATLVQPFEAVLTHEHSHIATDETGAPGFFGHGLGMIPLAGADGKIDPAGLAGPLAAVDQPHWQAPAALSITNATEYGGVYTAGEIAALTQPVKAKGYRVHLDGARLANAAASGFDLKAIKDLGVDILVFGGTKSGMSPTEAIVLLDKSLVRRFDARLKQSGQLPSKGRFYAAPFIGMLKDGAILRHAAHANAMAKRLAALSPFRVTHPVEANAVFVEMDEPTLKRLHATGWFVYRFIDGSVRFMCSWATTPEAVDELGAVLKGLA
ncbi:threonine aldolase family protein [Phenylobacterium aquaticum]|uniref:threonine aldolase family protein n=1 Tax=Phenylobacterium aquaticum TaxID=1763816 RepID=UPI001F5DA302|nr:low specificity L-threonine aldolase [Phenylobacterium aquaticum]MCI3135569.1 low specificity L-threonine aldolase [Phenylobacterium aquaticum]